MKRNWSVLILLGLVLLGAGKLVWAQEETPPLPPPAQLPQMWSAQELNNLVAPIALYPDPLLGQLLVASTYPLEVVEANQWLQQNKNLRGRELMDAAKQQSWDPSVQALVAVPDALAMLNQDIRWTTDLGDAFLAQQAEVMSAVQQMRAQARGNGRLSSTPQQTVTTEDQEGQQVIVIQPANPQIIYVPYYDPSYVWGPPVYGYYPPLYYSRFGFGSGFNLSFYFDDWGGWGGWGWGPSWFGRSVFVNYSFFPRYGFHRGFRDVFRGRTIWAHDPGHRLGIPYRNHQVAARFERASLASRNSFRAGAGSRVAAAPYANVSAGRFAGRTEGQGSRNPARQQRYQASQQSRAAAPQVQRSQSQLQQRYQAPQQPRAAAPQVRRSQSQPQQRYQAPQQPRAAAPQVQRSQSQPQQRYQAPQQPRAAAPQVQRSQSQPQQRYQAPQQPRAAAPQVQRSQSQPQQRYQAPQQPRAAAPQVQRFQSQPQQRYQAPQQFRAAAPQSQRSQSQPQQRYQAPQQNRSAPQMSAPRSSSGGGFSGRQSSNGGGGRRR